MHKKTIKNIKAFAIVAMFGVSANLGWAAVTACGSATAVNLGNGATGGITGTGAAGNTPTHGCGVTDLGFNSFVVTPTVGTADLAGPAAASIDPTGSGGVISGGNTISNISLTLSGAFTTGSHLGAHTVDETISFLATPNLGGAAAEPTTPAGDFWALKGIAALSATGISVTGGSGIPTGVNAPTITVTETICIGQSALVNCSAANEATVTLLVTYSGNGTTLTTTTANSSSCTGVAVGFNCVASGGGITFNPTESAFIIDTVAINHPASSNNAYTLGLASFTDPFIQGEATPEPSSFILMGTALLGVAAFRFRKQKSLPA